MKFFVLTHCESCYNKRGLFTGQVDSVLTDDGKRHSQLLAEKLKNERIDIAYTSPMKRTKQTLKYILKYHPETKVVIDKRIIERDYGELSRKSKSKYEREHPDIYPLYHRSYEIAPPGGENMIVVEDRVMKFLKEVLIRMKKEKINVLVVTHSNAIRPIRRYFENLSVKAMLELENNRHRVFTYTVT